MDITPYPHWSSLVILRWGRDRRYKPVAHGDLLLTRHLWHGLRSCTLSQFGNSTNMQHWFCLPIKRNKLHLFGPWKILQKQFTSIVTTRQMQDASEEVRRVVPGPDLWSLETPTLIGRFNILKKYNLKILAATRHTHLPRLNWELIEKVRKHHKLDKDSGKMKAMLGWMWVKGKSRARLPSLGFRRLGVSVNLNPQFAERLVARDSPGTPH